MTKKRIIFLILTTLMFGSLLYISARIPSRDMPHYLRDFRPEHIWLPIASTSGIILWLWALYDWGMRKMDGLWKFIWLIIIITTVMLGAVLYFICVGLRREKENSEYKTGAESKVRM